MTRRTTLSVAILLCNLAMVLSDIACCQGQNLLNQNGSCMEGKIKEMPCDMKVMFFLTDFETMVDREGRLVFLDNNDTISADQFCFTKSKSTNTDIIVLCHEDDGEVIYRIINVTLSLISIVFIFLTICVYMMLPNLLDVQGICLIQSISGLGVSFIFLGCINLLGSISYTPCHLLAYMMYFSFMYAFFWLNILCFHIWNMVVQLPLFRGIKRWKLVYHLIGIGGPFLLLLFLLFANFSEHEMFRNIHPGIAEQTCWFKDSTSTLIYFYGPISVLLCVNVVYFVWTTVVLCQQMNTCSEKKTKVLKYRLLLSVKLFFIMGICWAFEILSALLEGKISRWIWVISDSINALQGLLIFLILVVFRKKVLRALANKKLCRSIRLPASWKTVQDDECEELEEELSLSAVQDKTGIPT